MFSILFRPMLLIAALLWMSAAQAGIVLNATRVIYQGHDKEASLGVHNEGTKEILLQSWVERQSSTDGAAAPGNPPFVVTPPLARMPGNGKQLLRIIYAGAGLPADRESVFWLNAQEIPQTASENSLQIAIRQRIKIFFRPDGLPGDPLSAPGQLQWQWGDNDVLQVANPGPYHVSMLRISSRQGGIELVNVDSRMIAPLEVVRLPFKGRVSDAPLELNFTSINDFGGQVPYRATLKRDAVTLANRAEPG